ncbi:DivIVA domain-containing protein [Nocardioides sp. Soil774]|uniref:DivIVA domain-containing protein n=1 Tax=Nocardioides sp. Soil774 TaxID=1736408 RepID=UPI0009E7AD84|nr:DivIVA domain-containing protein [Nocardioides sp. Soil774]
MVWLFAILVVLVMGGVAMVASGRGGSMPPAYDDRPDLVLPEGRPLEAGDLRRVRFGLAVRGYRMSDVDALLDRLATELEDRTGTGPAADGPAPEASSGDPARD